jgi:hypothetical protein
MPSERRNITHHTPNNNKLNDPNTFNVACHMLHIINHTLIQILKERMRMDVKAAQRLGHSTEHIKPHEARQVGQQNGNIKEFVVVPRQNVMRNTEQKKKRAHWNSRFCVMRFVTRDETDATIISLRIRATLSLYSPYLTLNWASRGVIWPMTHANEHAPVMCYGVSFSFGKITFSFGKRTHQQ